MNGDMKKHGSSYGRFAAMIATSTIVMFGLMYLNSYALDHIYYSQTRTWMAVYMGAVMAIIMLGFMRSMYNNRRMNAIIVAASLIDTRGMPRSGRMRRTVEAGRNMRPLSMKRGQKSVTLIAEPSSASRIVSMMAVLR